ncbi:TetR family transcriptional regulator [Blastococcus deserti]|uniref:TetR family transcriptional regulator n=1 Tax=Blastococcus deserti TaxID=2259033 RepID=A0ABW4XCQ2_9ACTN
MKPEAVTRSSLDKIAHARDQRDPRRDAGPGEPTGRRARDRRDSRWDEHRATRRRQLVDATLAAIGKHGAGVGMDEIAAEAGTSKTVVYRHFADRSELYVAVCARVADRLLTELRAAMESGTEPRQMVAAAIETYLAFLEADPELYRFVVHQQVLDRPVDADPITNLSDLVGEQAAALVAVALDQAGRDPAAAQPWGHGLVGLVRAAADWWLQADRPMIRRDLAAHLTDLAWAGLSGVVTPASPRKEEP